MTDSKSESKSPRASITIDILDDPDYMDLVDRKGGLAAFGLYVALICAAKAQKNHGFFKFDTKFISRSIKINQDEISPAVNLLIDVEWLAVDEDGFLTILGFSKWNPMWGGVRKGAGRKSGIKINQDKESSGIKSVPSVSVSTPVTTSISSPKSNIGAEVIASQSEEDDISPYDYHESFKEAWSHQLRKVHKRQAYFVWVKTVHLPDDMKACTKASELFARVWNEAIKLVPTQGKYVPKPEDFFDGKWEEDPMIWWREAIGKDHESYPPPKWLRAESSTSSPVELVRDDPPKHDGSAHREYREELTKANKAARELAEKEAK